MAAPSPFSVTVHPYRSRVSGSCAYELGPTTAKNAIVFIGGLFDGPHTVPYARTVAKFVEEAKDLDYSLFEIRMRSSFTGFGMSSLKQDVEDISALVKYLRSIGREKVVLFGHSTGCQDCMEYADYEKHGSSPVDGFIIQAPVSDREALKENFPNYDDLLAISKKMIADGEEKEYVSAKLIPPGFNAPLTAYRLHSLLAKGGDDDYFSSDFDEATRTRIWGRLTKPVLVLHSEDDEYVPVHVNQDALRKLYHAASPLVSPLSGSIPDATHAVANVAGREWLAKTVVKFLLTLE
ncbi:hypothetical protein ISF_06543 [Cordyceps fumosorosea ARSEF 2679]|uniref:Esterase/lipase superfamily protein n=1 Tax=Cordyceps fumosorosea (strain ARSEF 2679) TaxID=1081104 RepID=A0A167RN56_CORFA|nr:hypothetical protein ISF_06543 [Cordyceps fumosorosea ARSEF 2679]OAA58760.1 hypothetical protein ISF_06543 [Cordyceps fumosorosea ARSEF 2679]